MDKNSRKTRIGDKNWTRKTQRQELDKNWTRIGQECGGKTGNLALRLQTSRLVRFGGFDLGLAGRCGGPDAKTKIVWPRKGGGAAKNIQVTRDTCVVQLRVTIEKEETTVFVARIHGCASDKLCA